MPPESGDICGKIDLRFAPGLLPGWFRSFRFFEPRADTGTCSAEWPFFPQDLIAASISGKHDLGDLRSDLQRKLFWDVTGSDTCVVIFVGNSYFPDILAAMRSHQATRYQTHPDAGRGPHWCVLMLLGLSLCRRLSFRSRRSVFSSPLWTPQVYGPTS